jgi:hypothetical protein
VNGLLLSAPPRSDQVAAPAIPWPTELDARGSTPPNHLSAVLAALAAIPPGHPQFLRTKTDPIQLLRAFAAKGVGAATRELPDGSWQTVVRRLSTTPSI